MPPYLKLGTVPRKRHTAHRAEPGFLNEGLYYEEVVTRSGFGRAYSIVYHLRPPTRVRKVESAGTQSVEFAEQPALRHHHLKTKGMSRAGDPIGGRVPLLANADVVLQRCRPANQQAELFRNATADEVWFIQRGRGVLLTQFGPLPFRDFDYVVIPRCTSYQFQFEEISSADLLLIESTGDVQIPERYLNPDGQIRMGAPYYERDFHGPTET